MIIAQVFSANPGTSGILRLTILIAYAYPMAARSTIPIEIMSCLPLNDSIPTTATTPIKPMINPKSLDLCQTVWSPNIEASIAAQIGTVATSSPVKPEVIFCSAFVIKYQGPISSVTV